MLIKNDESCNSEKTILRYQENGIADLLASDWYGIMLLSPGGRVYLDNYNDIHGIGNDVPLEFVRNCVEWDSLIHNKSMTYTYKEWNFLIYSIRQTDKDLCRSAGLQAQRQAGVPLPAHGQPGGGLRQHSDAGPRKCLCGPGRL